MPTARCGSPTMSRTGLRRVTGWRAQPKRRSTPWRVASARSQGGPPASSDAWPLVARFAGKQAHEHRIASIQPRSTQPRLDAQPVDRPHPAGLGRYHRPARAHSHRGHFRPERLRQIDGLDAFAAGLAARGLPAALVPVLTPIGASVEFFGGLAIVFGLMTRYAALLMIAFVIVATLISHSGCFRARS